MNRFLIVVFLVPIFSADAATRYVNVNSVSTASANGGGLYIGNGTEARNCLVVDNTAQSAWGFPAGGGVWISGSILFYCTVYGNQSMGGTGDRPVVYQPEK